MIHANIMNVRFQYFTEIITFFVSLDEINYNVTRLVKGVIGWWIDKILPSLFDIKTVNKKNRSI